MKTITVTDEAYDTIKKLKEKDESFSGLLIRIGKPRLTAQELFGALRKSEREASEAQLRLKKTRAEASANASDREKKLEERIRNLK